MEQRLVYRVDILGRLNREMRSEKVNLTQVQVRGFSTESCLGVYPTGTSSTGEAFSLLRGLAWGYQSIS